MAAVAEVLTHPFSSGNWDPKTQDARYSTKIPLTAIKAMAGFGEDEGLHFNPRTACDPPEEFKRKIFPWIEEELDKVFQKNEIESNTRITAVRTFAFGSTFALLSYKM